MSAVRYSFNFPIPSRILATEGRQNLSWARSDRDRGNRVRLIAAIHYNRKKVYIRAVRIHAEYDKDKWKE